ncbi:MAG: hypothetical protein D6746_05580 [Bacteroidetes bacterium]|nr:MAG: hypothetical protein D6746_05580 [Bacteroidota bacterium]
MAVELAKLTGDYPLRGSRLDAYLLDVTFTTNGANAPSGVSPAITGLTVARSATGTYTLTFAEALKPNKVLVGLAQVQGDEPDLWAKVVSYDKSTGVATVKVYQNSAGTIAAADTSSKAVKVLLVCSRSSRA